MIKFKLDYCNVLALKFLLYVEAWESTSKSDFRKLTFLFYIYPMAWKLNTHKHPIFRRIIKYEFFATFSTLNDFSKIFDYVTIGHAHVYV